MNYLLDTCIISEAVKPKPEKTVVEWLESIDEDSLYLSVLTLGEIQKGLARMKVSKRKMTLQKWLDHDLKNRFEGRLLAFDLAAALKWGYILGTQEGKGVNIPLMDSLIAAVALAHDLVVVTRNEKDMQAMGVQMFNPFK